MIETILDPQEMPVSLEDSRNAARVNGTDNDSEIRVQVAFLAAEAEHITGRAIINRTIQMTLPSFPAAIEAPAIPFGSVSEIIYRDEAGNEQTLSTAAWVVDRTTSPPSIVRAPGYEWPATQVRNDAVKVRVICGYGADSSSVPAPFKAYILAKVREYFAPAGTPESPHLVRMLDSLKVY